MSTALAEPSFPPLMSGRATLGADPFAAARKAAAEGCDGGLILHNVTAERLRAAIVFAPDVPLAQAVAMLPVCAVGLQNALGALAPPEVGVHLDWSGPVRVNGARCGGVRMAADTSDPDEIPGWLVVGWDLVFSREAEAPGETPDETALYEEGCGDLDPVHLLEAWARHTLVWINRWTDEGNRPVHAEWTGLLHDTGKTVTVAGRTGEALGADEAFGLLLKNAAGTHLIPLTTLLEGTQ
ncbi:Biotin-(acetyl-CoA carboxylase) ligase [Tranquillimonas alkanivorans]|uniref:Biotin-(Acetyl-CoA carboxylase) ligase n=1 Tax=Tranquillimonas alkanivorans TaxID=441119 RepID=A0A1I5KJ21_9RHOB|nr:Biotin-(acetyl-CoA carboxylase) ligase [Tranquillimonas alkanivorans]